MRELHPVIHDGDHPPGAPAGVPGRLGIHAARMTVLQMPLIPEQGVVRRVVPHAFAAEIRFGPGHPVIRAAPDAVRQDFLRRQVSRGQHELVPRAGQRRNPRPFRAEKRRRIHAVFQANQDLRLHHHQQPRIGIHEYRIHRHI